MTNSGQPLTYWSHIVIVKDKSKDSGTSEMCRAKWKWMYGEPSNPKEHRTLTSPSCVTTPKSLRMPVSMDFYCSFTKQTYWLNHCPLVAVLSLSALFSPKRFRKFKPIITSSMISLITDDTTSFSSQRPSRIVFTFIITEGKERQEIPWLSPITLLSGFLPLLFYFILHVELEFCSQFLLSLPSSPLLFDSSVENSGAWEMFYMITGMSPLDPLSTSRNASGSCSRGVPG